MEKDTQDFISWLATNGCRYDKINWPTNETESGSRGAVALETIRTNEVMLEIPKCVMMCEPQAFEDPDIGQFLQASRDIIKGDVILAVFVMNELRKQERSFYYPYLKIIPEPDALCEWSNEELDTLQDTLLKLRAKNKLKALEYLYNSSVVVLCSKYPDVFPIEEFGFKAFKFAWFTILARAFGRRLPWSALVPFADCLNHANVQTKYDYDVGGNGLFRLFPTGKNQYNKGVEVFNSYGRRANDNLLLEYGFSMVDNEWDKVDMYFNLPSTEPLYRRKVIALLSTRKGPSFRAHLQRGHFPFDALSFLRVVNLTEAELSLLDGDRESDDPSSKCAQQPPPLRQAYWSDEVGARGQAGPAWGEFPLSLESELKAVHAFRCMLDTLVSERTTTTAQDEMLLAQLQRCSNPSNVAAETDRVGNEDFKDIGCLEGGEQVAADESVGSGPAAGNKWRQICAVTYRLTRKRIVDLTVKKMQVLESFLESCSTLSVEQEATAVVGFLLDAINDADGVRILNSGSALLGDSSAASTPSHDVESQSAALEKKRVAHLQDYVHGVFRICAK